MLALSLVEETERLLAEGRLSQRQIALRVGVSRGTVNAIATGRRGAWGRESGGEHGPLRSGLAQRCPKCGYRVVMPCLICEAREYQSRLQEMHKLTLQKTEISPPLWSPHGLPAERVA